MIPAIFVSVAYVAAQMLADISSLKIISLAGFSIDGGTFVYALTFTLRDLVHKVAGIKAARALIVAAAVINLVMAGMFWFISWLPADPAVGPQTEFGTVLAPVWRIVFASIAAEVLSEFIDTEIYRLWIERVTRRFQWLRVLTSNAISIPLDSLTFCWLAFGGVYAAAVVWSITLSNIITKGFFTLVSLPGIYIVKEKQTPEG
jgi:uncharacterized integral membrane protein (TIGR00697 family)